MANTKTAIAIQENELDRKFRLLLEQEDDETEPQENKGQKRPMINLEAVKANLLKLKTERDAVEAQSAASGDWLKKKTGVEEYFIVPFSDDVIYHERKQCYINNKLFNVTPVDSKVVVETMFWKMKNAANNDKDKINQARTAEASDVVVFMLQNAKTGVVKLHKLKIGYKNHLAGAKLRDEVLGMIESGDDPTQFKLTVTGVDKSLGNGKTYVEESTAFARKPSKPPAIEGELPKFDTSFASSDEIREALVAYGRSVGLLAD